MFDSVSVQFASSYNRFFMLVDSRCASSHSFYEFLSRCTIGRIGSSIVLLIGRLKILFRSCRPLKGHLDSTTIVSICTIHRC
jgi:hypothetical protein